MYCSGFAVAIKALLNSVRFGLIFKKFKPFPTLLCRQGFIRVHWEISQHEIIRRGIDGRFSISIVKEILRRFEIEYTAVHIAKSNITNKTLLYIEVRNSLELREFEVRTQSLFTTDFYNEFCAHHHLHRRAYIWQTHMYQRICFFLSFVSSFHFLLLFACKSFNRH